jgi:hypothetical protein
MAIAPSFGAGMSARAPRKLPAAVLAAPNLVLADLLFQGGQLVDPVIDLVRPLIEDREQFRNDFPVIPLDSVHLLELDHLRQGKPENLEPIDEFQPADIIVGVDPLSLLHPSDAVKQSDLLVIPDRSLGQVDHPGQFADGINVRFLRGRGHLATLR